MIDDSEKKELDEKPPLTKQILEVLQLLRRRNQKRGDFDVFEKCKAYEEIFMKLAEKGEIQSTSDGFLSKIN